MDNSVTCMTSSQNYSDRKFCTSAFERGNLYKPSSLLRNMKIGFLITYFYPQTGGAENNCYYLARELAKRHEVHVFCSGAETKNEMIEGIQVHRHRELLRIKYYFAWYPSIVRSILEAHLDVLHVHGFGFLQHDAVVRCLREEQQQIKLVCTPHGPFMALKKYGLLASMFKRAYLPSLKRSLTLYDRIIQVNPLQYIWMKSEYGVPRSKIKLVPNGIPHTSCVPMSKQLLEKVSNKYSLKNKFVVSYLGRIQKYKGLDQVIRALPSIIQKHPEVLFIAIGKDAGDRVRLVDLARSLKVTNHILFTGEVNEKEKLALLELSEIFVFPSEWEAFGIATLEAMARGNAVVSSATEGSMFLIKNKVNGFLFEYGRSALLGKHVSCLIENKKIREAMQTRNRLKAKQFFWEKIASDLENVYLSI